MSRATEGEAGVEMTSEEEGVEDVRIDSERYGYLSAHEEFVLTLSEFGYGKRSSSYDFRTSGRGGKGIRATDINRMNEIGQLVAGFPVEPGDEILLVTDRGQLIRVPVEGIRTAGRATRGVTIFRTAEGRTGGLRRAHSRPGRGRSGRGGGRHDRRRIASLDVRRRSVG